MTRGYFSQDAREFLFLLHQHGVRYLIVGGEAVIFHGYARLTGDLDIFYDCSEENVRRLYRALSEFWGGEVPGLKGPQDLTREVIIQFGVPPNRIDLLGSIDGVSFAEAWENRVTDFIRWKRKKVPVFYISLDDLIRNKEASQRPRDLEDLKYLRAARKKKPDE